MNKICRSNPLDDILKQLDKQCEVLGKARNVYLGLEVEKRYLEANLVIQAPGKSHAEKVTNAQGSVEWLEFHKRLARAEAVFEFQKLKYDVLSKEWQSRYLEMKLDGAMLGKQ